MDRAYIDNATHQAICCWNAPDQKTVETLFEQAGVIPESIREVVAYSTS